MDSKDHNYPGRNPDDFLGGGEMGERTRSFDWSRTPTGPAAHWPQGLKTAVRIMLGSRYAMWLGWGPEFTFFYNDAYARMTLGPKHPWALGRSAREVWSEIWDDIGPRAESVLRTGEATWDEGLLLFLERQGFPEETYHTFSYSPLPADAGGVGGMLCVVTEDTERTIGERRLRTLRELAARTTDEARSSEEACQTAAHILAANPYDLPFALLYLSERDGERARLSGLTGVSRDMATSPAVVELADEGCPWPFRRVVATGSGVEVDHLLQTFGPLTAGVWPEPPQKAVVLPLAKPGQTQLAGFVVAGVSPRRPFDDDYRGFFDLLAGQIATAVANARAYEEERRRAEALAELDRAKTAFFSNVSHEFRTPLTLMLGPVEDMLSRSYTELSPAAKGQLEVVNRNGLRLLRLVNSLLDFSRIEAGRVRAAYQPTDLAALTAELASVFRAAVERAGMRLVVHCPPLAEPAYVDRDMWEKIVLNLLSNAFKFTFEGEITVTQRQADGHVELTVRDTGTGIAAEQMPRLFERFHRIENARARTHEGTGIGLALVQELVKLHGGSISAQSVMGQGATFTVTVPLGKGHLPPDQIGESRSLASTATGATPYVEEALRWLPDEPREGGGEQPELPTYQEPLSGAAVSVEHQANDERPTILVADDNADMRQYVVRLLAERYRVVAVADGEAALAEASKQPPDLILTDVMMPRLDGFGLLGELRADPRTREVPVLMLSARAGEESRVEGMDAGADDYLVKPFSARELLARVGAHLQMAQQRREAAEALRQGEERLRMALTAARMVAWEWDPAEDRVVLSDNAAEVFGLLPGSACEESRQGFDLLHPDDVGPYRATVLKAVEECGSYQSQFRMIRPDNGQVSWFEARGHGVADEAGKAVRLAGVVLDITERKRAELALQTERDLLSVTLASIGDAVITTDTEGRITNMNAVAESLTGWSKEEAAGQALDEVFRIVNENTRRPVENPATRALREGVIMGLANHTFLIRKDGTEWPIDDSAAPIRGTDGAIVGCVLVFRDVTDRRTAEQRRQRSEERYRALVTASAQVVWTTDPEGRAVKDSPSWRAFTGQTYDEWKDWGWLNAIHPEDREQTAAAWRQAVESTTPCTTEYRVRRQDGEYRWTAVRAVPVLNADESVREWIGTNTDITELKRAEAEAAERARLVALRADISATLAAAQPLQPGLQACCEAFVRHLDMAFARVWTPDGPGEMLVLQASAGQYTHLDGPHSRIKVGDFKIGRIAASQRPHLTNDVQHDANISDPAWAEREGMIAFAGFPLVVEGAVVGVMAMFARQPLTEAMLIDLAPLTDQVAQYIHRKWAEEALRESELRYRLVGQAANDAIWDWDLLTNEVAWNEGVQARFGFTAEEVEPEATWWMEHIHPDDRVRVVHGIHAAIHGSQELWQDEYRFRRADHSYAHVFDRGRVVRAETGKPIRMVGSMLDLTERMVAERRLREQEKQYRSIFESTSDAILVFDYEGRLRETNPAACAMHGYAYGELLGMHGTQFVHPDDQYKFADFVRQVTAGEEFHVAGTHVRKDGTPLSVQVTGTSFVFAGQPALLAVVRDVTEERKAVEALRESEEKLRLLADTIPQLAWMARPDGHIFWYNNRWYEYTGATPAEMEGWGWQSVHDPDMLPQVVERWRGSLATGESFDMVFPLKGADGQFRPFLTRVNPLRDQQGNVRYWFGTNTDITEQRRIQEELRDLAAKLSEADRRKDEFLATLAHELRNPLAPIRTGLEVMRLAKDDPATVAEVRTTMERQAQQLITLVDDLLDVSRITRGKLELRKCRVELAEVVRSAMEASKPFIDEAGHALTVSLPDQPVALEADPHRLAQVLSNLLNNSAKYTPEGGRIRLTAQPQGAEVVIAVQDTGIGIPADMLEDIFEMFAQIDRPMEKGYTGLGIGLTLVKSLVEMHRGTVEVRSEGTNRGSEFRVRLPTLAGRPEADGQPAPSGRPASRGKRRVLVVDDNKAAADMLGMVVQMLGNEVRTANDGQQAVAAAAEFLPDVILMDLGMPRMNGYEAARHIRQQPWGATIRLVALTGWGQEEDKQRTKEAGFDHHLVKPAEPSELQRLFAESEPNAPAE